MSVEENKARLRQFYKTFNAQKYDQLDDLIAPGFISHRTTGDITKQDLIEGARMLFSSFPDFEVTIDHLVAEGNMIAFRETCTGTHKGEFAGFPPTGNNVRFTSTTILEMEDGKWKEAWPTIDHMGLAQQLSAIPEGRQ